MTGYQKSTRRVSTSPTCDIHHAADGNMARVVDVESELFIDLHVSESCVALLVPAIGHPTHVVACPCAGGHQHERPTLLLVSVLLILHGLFIPHGQPGGDKQRSAPSNGSDHTPTVTIGGRVGVLIGHQLHFGEERSLRVSCLVDGGGIGILGDSGLTAEGLDFLTNCRHK